MACRDQGLLVGQGDILARFYGRNGGPDTDHADYRCDDSLCCRDGGSLHQAFHAPGYLYVQVRDPEL